MRSWQRIMILGLWLVLAGTVATVAHTEHPHNIAQISIALAGVIGLGIGASVIASAIVARMVANQVLGLNIREAVEALRGASPVTRSNQALGICLELVGDKVRVIATHTFDALGSSRVPRRIPFILYTDAARWGVGGGFCSILEPDGNRLHGAELNEHVQVVEGKKQFTKSYKFSSHCPSTFSIETYGMFRRSDRLIWTVQHLSSDFAVHILDRRGVDDSPRVKVNHHREADIVASMEPHESLEGYVIDFSYLGEVLPYQGFELQWTDEPDTGEQVGGAPGDGALVHHRDQALPHS